MQCRGVGSVEVRVASGAVAEVNAYVSDIRPLDFDMILGMNGVFAFGGVSVTSQGNVGFFRSGTDFCGDKLPTCAAAVSVKQKDFRLSFDDKQRAWTVEWHWPHGQEPPDLVSHVEQYPMSSEVKAEFDDQINQWIEKGWLQPYNESRHGPPRALIPMMAVVQENKKKVRPVLDYRALNAFLDAHTGDSDVCADKLREWRRQGVRVSTLDLTSAYMQVRVVESLWPFQTVMFQGKRFCLTRLGFGLSIAPLVMKAVLAAALAQDDKVDQATSPYVDDILVNESILPADAVRAHLLKFGLECKPAERLANGARVLGLKVWGEPGQNDSCNRLSWGRGNELPDVPTLLTRRNVFSFCGRLTGHLPVCNWVRPAVAYLKRIANSRSTGWDDEIVDESLRSALEDVIQRVRQNDPSRGVWNVSGQETTVWVDASSLAAGAVIEAGGCVIEDGCWLRPTNDSSHINLAELDALLRGVNMALAWKMKVLHVKTDSATVYHWISDALSGKARLRTKSASEMLIRRRVGTLKAIIEEYDLLVDVSLVASANNQADALTRVPQRWLKSTDLHDCAVTVESVCGAADTDFLVAGRIFQIHCDTGHQGIDRSLYFVRRLIPSVNRDDVERVVKKCQVCSSIDPAPVRWERGHLDVPDLWSRLAMDITHVNGQHYLTLIDCGPSRFSLWKRLKEQSSGAVVAALESVFFERGAPVEILTDNDPAFRGAEVAALLKKWGVHVRFRCAYAASGNGIAERSHRTVKRIAARKKCSIEEALYWYNISPKDNALSNTAPVNRLHNYSVRVMGEESKESRIDDVKNLFKVGDMVWVKPDGARCNTRFRLGKVTGVISRQAVEVDNMPRHVRDLRLAHAPDDDHGQERSFDSDREGLGDAELWPVEDYMPVQETSSHETNEGDELWESRRSVRVIRPPDRFGVHPWT